MFNVPGAEGSSGGRLVLAACYLVIAVEGYDISAIGIAAPAIVRELHVSPSLLSLVFSASMAGMLVGALAFGRLSDVVGRAPVLGGCLAAMGALTLATVEARSPGALILLRLLVGLALGGALPTLIALASDASSAGGRAGAISFMFGGLSLGGVACALTAHAAFSNGGWRTIFIVGGLLPLALTPIALLLRTRGAKLRAAVQPVPYGAALFGEGRARSTLALWLMAATTLVIFYLLLNWLPTFTVLKGYPSRSAPLAILAFNVGNLLGAFGVGAAVRAGGLRPTLGIIYTLLAGSLVLLGSTRGFWPFIGLAAAAGLLVNAAQAAIYGATPGLFPEAARATGAGSVVGAARIGSILGPLYAGALFALHLPVGTILVLTAPVLLLAAVALLALGAPQPVQPAPGAATAAFSGWRGRAA